MARCWGLSPTTSADSAPRTQAVTAKGSVCTFWKPRALSLATPHSIARFCAADPAGRAPTSVVRDATTG